MHVDSQCGSDVMPARLGPGTPHDRLDLGLVMLLALLVGAMAITTRSFWLDEAGTAFKAVQPSIGQWWETMRAEGNSNLQLPLYMIYSWGWEKLAGGSEAALRAGNVPWMILGLFLFAKAIPDRKLRWASSLFFLTNAFVWYYLDDARPYPLQLGCSLAVLASILKLAAQPEPIAERRWMLVFSASSILLAASGLLAMLWLGAYWLASALSTSKQSLSGLLKRHRALLAATIALLGFIGVYYLWTLTLGARASAATTDIRNLCFILYELLGFSGLGPGRLEIRTGGLATFKAWLPGLALYALAFALVVAGCFVRLKTFRLRTVLTWAAAFSGVLVLLIAVGVAVKFRVLGRHCTPVFPLIAFLGGLGLAALFDGKHVSARLLAILFLLTGLISCFGIRFGERHGKDDYRAAAAIARDALGRNLAVWWNADEQGALVYGVPLENAQTSEAAAHFIRNPESGFSPTIPPPDVVLASKPDIYDNQGALHDWLIGRGYSRETNLMAFTVWRSPRLGPK